MKYVKPLRLLNNSINILNLTQKEKETEDIKIQDLVLMEVKLLKKAYKCNTCEEGICYFDILEATNEDNEIICVKCNEIQLLKDSVRYEDWMKRLK